MAASIGILFVDGRSEHTNGAQEELAVFFSCLLQTSDKALDVACHVVEGLRQFTDFRSAAYGGAFVKLSSADGACRGGQRTDRRADANRKEVAEDDCGGGDHQHEGKCLGVEFSYTGVIAGLFQAALGDHGPAEVGNGAKGADQFGLLTFHEHETSLS